MGVIRVVFWLWFVVSIGILVLRVVNKRAGTEATPVDGRLSTWDSLLGKQLPGEEPLPSSTGLLGTAPPPAAGTTTGSDAASAERSHSSTTPRHGLFASDDEHPADQDPAPAPQVGSVAEALRSVEWPCGLTPVVDLSAGYAADRQVAFSTTEAAAAEVGRRLGDALEARGYVLHSTSDTTVDARRADAVLEVRIHPEAARAERHGVPAYPSLPPLAVVVEFTLHPS